ncbi:MAG: hypothetical protein GY898_15920 [Proteobacteria bacterium]|nr:hypothetical protein [Pseudomonadota bacterium]
MIRAVPRPLNTRRLELAPPILTLLPHADDRPVVGIALALAHGLRCRVRALALHGPGEDLPLPLKMALFGLDPRSEADRAIRHLVDSARRGAHVAVRVIKDDDGVAAQAAVAQALPDGVPLVVGRVRGGHPLELERLTPVLEAHGGPFVVVDVPRGPAPAEILAVLPGPKAPGYPAASEAVDALERGYPTFRPKALVRPDDLEVAAKDCAPETLMVVGLPSHRGLGPLAGREGRLDTLSPGPVAAIIPPGPEASRTVGRLFGREQGSGDQGSGKAN